MSVTGETLTPPICRARRRLAGLTVDELADRLGWPADRLAAYERGGPLSASLRDDLADALEQGATASE